MTSLKQAGIAGSLTLVTIAIGLMAEVLVGAALFLGDGAGGTAFEPLFRLQFTAIATYFSAEAVVDQAIDALFGGARSFAAACSEQLQGLLTIKLQAHGDDISVVFLGIKWVLAGG